jgi:hypothetical protein
MAKPMIAPPVEVKPAYLRRQEIRDELITSINELKARYPDDHATIGELLEGQRIVIMDELAQKKREARAKELRTNGHGPAESPAK